jgi:hypothetical protein
MASQNFLEFPGKSPPHYHVESTWHLITHSIWHGFYHLCDRSSGLIPWPILVVIEISYHMVHSHYLKTSDEDTPKCIFPRSYDSQPLISTISSTLMMYFGTGVNDQLLIVYIVCGCDL